MFVICHSPLRHKLNDYKKAADAAEVSEVLFRKKRAPAWQVGKGSVFLAPYTVYI